MNLAAPRQPSSYDLQSGSRNTEERSSKKAVGFFDRWKLSFRASWSPWPFFPGNMDLCSLRRPIYKFVKTLSEAMIINSENIHKNLQIYSQPFARLRMAEQSSISTAQPSLSDRVSSFYSEMETVMLIHDINQWARELSGTFESLDLDLVREDQKDRERPVSLSVPSLTTPQAPSERRPPHERRIRFLAQTVIKVLGNGSADNTALGSADRVLWARSLNVFNTAHRKGTPLSQDQLALIVRACAAAFQYPAGLPSDAYNIIADYLIAKKAEHEIGMLQLLAGLSI